MVDCCVCETAVETGVGSDPVIVVTCYLCGL